MAESLSGHQVLPVPPTSQTPQEGRGFFEIRKEKGQFPIHPKNPRLATISLCNPRVMHRWVP